MLHKRAEDCKNYALKEKVHFFDIEIVFAYCSIVQNGAPYQHRGLCSNRERNTVARTGVQLFFSPINLYGELGVVDSFVDVVYYHGNNSRVEVLEYRHYQIVRHRA